MDLSHLSHLKLWQKANLVARGEGRGSSYKGVNDYPNMCISFKQAFASISGRLSLSSSLTLSAGMLSTCTYCYIIFENALVVQFLKL